MCERDNMEANYPKQAVGAASRSLFMNIKLLSIHYICLINDSSKMATACTSHA